MVPTAGLLPAHSSKEIPQKAAENKLLQQQWFQLPGTWEGLCRLGHHSFAVTTRGTALNRADPDPHLDVGGGIAVHVDITAPHDCGSLWFWLLDFKGQRFHFLRCWTLLVVAAIGVAEASN